MSSSRRAQDTSQQTPAAGLKVTLPVLVTASVLFLAALVLAYLGGVMTGRAQWASSLEESRAALAAAAATDGEKEESAAAGEALRRRGRPGHRQLQHQIRAAAHGSLGAHMLAADGKIAALDEVSAHRAYNGGILSQSAADLADLPGVPGVKGIIFTYDTSSFHGNPLKTVSIR